MHELRGRADLRQESFQAYHRAEILPQDLEGDEPIMADSRASQTWAIPPAPSSPSIT